ncbi:MAG: LysR substrate-binding domain-containing protein [Gaiella sp.]
MILRNLTYLVALAREGHFGRAATACHVSQPTLSAGIRTLEAELGVLLVRRERRYEGLTPEGQRVLDWAARVVSDVEGLRNEIVSMREGMTGHLRLGAVPTSLSAASLVTTPFHTRHPSVTVSVLSASSRQIERGLHDFELDIGLTYLDNEPLAGVRSLPLYRERYLLLTQACGELAGRRELRWEEVAELPLALLTDDMQNRRIVDAAFAGVGASPLPSIETNSVSTLVAHVRDGPWSSIVATPWLRLFAVPRGVRAIPLVDPVVEHWMGLVTLDREPSPLLARAMLESAAEAGVEATLSR